MPTPICPSHSLRGTVSHPISFQQILCNTCSVPKCPNPAGSATNLTLGGSAPCALSLGTACPADLPQKPAASPEQTPPAICVRFHVCCQAPGFVAARHRPRQSPGPLSRPAPVQPAPRSPATRLEREGAEVARCRVLKVQVRPGLCNGPCSSSVLRKRVRGDGGGCHGGPDIVSCNPPAIGRSRRHHDRSGPKLACPHPATFCPTAMKQHGASAAHARRH